MPIIRTGETDHDKELEKWNTPKRLGGYNADGYEPYPKMLYKAFRDETGKARCGDIRGLYTSDPVIQAESAAFTARCQHIVKDALQHSVATGQGWSESPDAALALLEAQQQDIALAAAEERYRVERMGEKARREYDAHDAATEAPATEVPVPVKKRGRKPNAPMVTVG